MRPGGPVLISGVIGVAAGLMAPVAGAQELPSWCGGLDGQVSAQDVPSRTAERFDLEQLAAAATAAEGLRRQFIQADGDGDGRISRDEWLRWFGAAHVRAMARVGDPRSGTD